MNKVLSTRNRSPRFFLLCIFTFGMLTASAAFCAEAVNVFLKNNSSGSVDAALIDQYGGNFSASIEAGMGTNQTLKTNSEIKVNGSTVHVVTAADEGKEIKIAN